MEANRAAETGDQREPCKARPRSAARANELPVPHSRPKGPTGRAALGGAFSGMGSGPLPGCPRPALVKVDKDRIRLLKRVDFQLSRGVILKRSYKVLDEVAEQIKCRPRWVVEVQVHLDDDRMERY